MRMHMSMHYAGHSPVGTRSHYFTVVDAANTALLLAREHAEEHAAAVVVVTADGSGPPRSPWVRG
jgi:hypothetical protein